MTEASITPDPATASKSAHVLACPVCQQPLHQQGKRFACEANHSFDMARQGYLNLLLANHKRSRAPGDNADMIHARQRFLDQGYYQAISEQLNALVCQWFTPDAQLADVGCGDGYYTARLIEAINVHTQSGNPDSTGCIYGVDISKEALKVAARRYKPQTTGIAVHWLVASGGRLPLLPHALDGIISLFTPVMPEGWYQALKPGGKLILATTGQAHLLELRQKIYPDVTNRVFDPTEKLLQQGFRPVQNDPIKLTTAATINAQDLPDLLTMTPHGWRSSTAARESVLALPQLTLTLDVDFRVYEAIAAAKPEEPSQ